MHTNYRRDEKNDFSRERGGSRWHFSPGTMKWWKRHMHSERRMLERQLMSHEEYDDIPDKWARTMLWDLL